MCGMTGFFCMGKQHPTAETLKQLLLVQTPRGTDACGMAFPEAGQIHIRKESVKPEDFVKQVEPALWERLAKAPYGLLHARNKTIGTITADSNHPVHQWGWAVTHNGTIKNDDDLYKYYGEERFADVDTAAVPLVLKQGRNYEDSLRYLSLLDGTATMVILSASNVDRVALVRLGIYDLFLFYDPGTEILYWSSLTAAASCLPGITAGNILFTAMSKLPENRVLILGPKQATKTYKVIRNPFSIPRTIVIVPSKSFKDGTGGSIQSSTTKPNDQPSLLCPYFHLFPERTIHHLQWGDSNIKVRGVPDLSQVERGLATYNLRSIDRWMHDNHRDKLEMPTIYGRWLFSRTVAGSTLDGVGLKREFRGRKSQKRMFHRCGHTVTLPTSSTELDRLLPFDTFNVSYPVGPTAVNTFLGWACPWCGVPRDVKVWETDMFRCSFCGIQGRRDNATEGN